MYAIRSYYVPAGDRLPGAAGAVDVGGVANLTWIGRDGSLLAFDTGPGNALIDDWVRRHTGATADIDGRLAKTGIVNVQALNLLLENSYFDRRPPKSRNNFV